MASMQTFCAGYGFSCASVVVQAATAAEFQVTIGGSHYGCLPRRPQVCSLFLQTF